MNESNKIISLCERLEEPLNIFYKQIEKPIIKTLNYISEINKNNIKIKEFINEPKCTLISSFDKSDITLEYINYYFSGLPIPEDIEIKQNLDNKITISWKINKNKIKEEDKDKIQYLIEMRNSYDIYFSYKSSDTKIVLKNVRKNVNYKIRIKTYLNQSYSECSTIKEFKIDEPKKINNIFLENDEEKFL